MNSSEIIENIELEIKKYIDISTIFKKLKGQGCIQSVFKSIYDVFAAEHDFTKKGILKLIVIPLNLFERVAKNFD